MLEAVLFDMDGLMFDTERLCIRAWDYAGEKMGLGKAGYMVMKTLGVNQAAADRIWREEFGLRYDGEKLRAYAGEFRARYFAEHPVPVKPGLTELLPFLQGEGLRMAVVSSTPERQVRFLLEKAGWPLILKPQYAGTWSPAPSPIPKFTGRPAPAWGSRRTPASRWRIPGTACSPPAARAAAR